MSSLVRSRSRLAYRATVIWAACLVMGCSSSSEPEGPRAPRQLSVEPMAGGLHVSWVNVEPTADAIELERKTMSPAGDLVADFSLLVTLPGAVDNKHDAAVTGRHTYVYRARCKKAGLYSGYSEELGGTPVDP